MEVSLFLKIMYLIWQLEGADSFGVGQIVINAAIQYGATVLGKSASAGNVSQISPRVLLEPILGLEVARKFIMAAETASQQRSRAATVAVFLANTLTIMLTMDPPTNAAAKAVTSTEIGYMRSVIEKTRGGNIQLLKCFRDNSVVPPLLSPAQMEFNHNCQIITENIFREHTARRYVQGVAQKFKFRPAYLLPIASIQLNTNVTLTLFGWTVVGGTVVIGTISFLLYLFQCEERKRYQKDKILIDVSASIDD